MKINNARWSALFHGPSVHGELADTWVSLYRQDLDSLDIEVGV